MACPRGAASPSAHTQRKLFAASGGYCQNPGCARELFIDFPEKPIHIAEMAHVFAANDDGPRANNLLTPEERGAYENLILLCATCHTIIDKAPMVFPDPVILGWKRQHADKLRSLFGVTHCKTREACLLLIGPLLSENAQIFKDYGPDIVEARNPESGADERWQRKVIQKIIPNNQRVLAQLDENRQLLSDTERETLEQFRQHIDDLQARHIEGYREGAARFPARMSEILRN